MVGGPWSRDDDRGSGDVSERGGAERSSGLKPGMREMAGWRPALAFYRGEGETEDREREEAPGSWWQSWARYPSHLSTEITAVVWPWVRMAWPMAGCPLFPKSKSPFGGRQAKWGRRGDQPAFEQEVQWGEG